MEYNIYRIPLDAGRDLKAALASPRRARPAGDMTASLSLGVYMQAALLVAASGVLQLVVPLSYMAPWDAGLKVLAVILPAASAALSELPALVSGMLFPALLVVLRCQLVPFV